MLLTQDARYKKGFKFDHVWPILKGIEKFSNNQTNRTSAFPEEGHTTFSSSSLQDDSSPTPGMNSFDLNTSGEEGSFNFSQRPMGVKKAKRKQQSEDQFKKLMEQNEKLIKAIDKGTSERNEILKSKVEVQRQKVEVQKDKAEVQRMREENRILFADLNTITDPGCRAYIEKQRAIILSRGVPTNQNEKHGEGFSSQYHGSQYQVSCYQKDQVQGEHSERQETQGEDQIPPSDPQEFSEYYNLLSGTNNNFSGY